VPVRLLFYVLPAALSGALLALAFPLPGYSGLAWVALVPLLLVMHRAPFRSGYVAGVVFFAVTLYWLNIVMVTYGRLHPFLSLIAYLLLVFYLALYFAAATWLCCRLKRKLGYPVALTLPVIWVALELLRGILLTGFPWVLLGYSQHDNLLLIQSVDLFGVYGISGLLILANAIIAALLAWTRDRGRRFTEGNYAVVLVLLLAANIGYGAYRLDADPPSGAPFPVTLVQGNVDQTLKWAPENQFRTIETYRRLSEQATGAGTGLIVWPESATPFYLQEPTVLQQAVFLTPQGTGVPLLTGSPAYQPNGDRSFTYFNSAFLVTPEGELKERSDKVHLVPFGEYVPLGDFLPFIDKLVVGIGDFSAGEINPIRLNGHQLGVLVCYEAIFPELARAYVNAGSALLVNLTNDAWFGRSSAPHQHLAMARFRAIENRRWLARAANTGITALIDPLGRITARTELFEEAVLSAPAALLDGSTFYGRFGDILPFFFLLVSVAWLWQSGLRK